MDDRKTEGPATIDDWMMSWLKMATDVGGELAKICLGFGGPNVSTPGGSPPAGRFTEFWYSNQKIWETAVKALSEPAALQAVLKGFQTAPEISLRLLQTSADGFLELQRRWIERLKKIGMPSDAYSFSDLDSEFLNRWTDLYKNEFRQFLNIPQLGLTKFYQEKINQALDKYNLFHAAMAEFLHLLSIPMERSFRVLQEKLAELTQTGKLPQDSKQYYQMWIKILEGHYMTLFQSSQYTETMSKTLDALGQFLAARNEVLEDAFKLLPVCTHRDVDEINREIYQLKRRLRTLERARRDPTTDGSMA
jgi:class III poly(R)-hydroxyalkanoic acid synthase PhaE subunit